MITLLFCPKSNLHKFASDLHQPLGVEIQLGGQGTSPFTKIGGWSCLREAVFLGHWGKLRILNLWYLFCTEMDKRLSASWGPTRGCAPLQILDVPLPQSSLPLSFNFTLLPGGMHEVESEGVPALRHPTFVDRSPCLACDVGNISYILLTCQ